jgi:hypothetical protein
MVEQAAQVISFKEALSRTEGLKRDILLGNGFSIAAYHDFNYRQLLDRANVSDEVRGIFASLRTTNFEAVMRLLLAEAANARPEKQAEVRRQIAALKEALVRSIHGVHPPRRTAIASERWERCAQFLEHFIGRKQGGRIFTTNYDLLLSWAVAPDRELGKLRRLEAYEGFRGGPYDALFGATSIYLHGALHLASDGGRPYQLQYRKSGVALHDQIAERLDQGVLPIFVSEGASSLKKPTGRGFLSDALAAFRGTCRTAEKKALFTLGHGLGPEDDHIISNIAKLKIPAVYLGAFGADEIEAFQKIAASWLQERAIVSGFPLKIFIFDSANEVWGPP